MSGVFTSTVPAAVRQLLAVFEAAGKTAGVSEVRDGPVVKNTKAKKVLVVGWSPPGEDQEVVEHQAVPEGQAGLPLHETYTVHCAAIVLSAAGNIQAAREDAYDLAGTVAAAVLADRRLGGAVMMTSVSAMSLRETQDERGAEATVPIDITCDAFAR